MMAAKPPSLTVRAATVADAASVDAYVRAHPNATPFHTTSWTSAVERGCGQRCETLIAEDGNGAIGGVLPLTFVTSPLFGKALVSSAFAVGGGVLADGDAIADRLIEVGRTRAQALDCAVFELRGGLLPTLWRHDSETYLGFARDLATSDDAELLAIPRKQRAEVRKALVLPLTVETGRDLAGHYAVYSESVRNLGTPVFPRALFTAMLDAFGSDADILTVRHGGKPVAAVLSLYWRGTVMPYWGGGTAEARGLRANELMYFALMRHARERGCTRFDFGRSKTGSGAAAFKRNWGFEEISLHYATLSLDGRTRDVNPSSARYRTQVELWKRLPLWAANRFGPPISRGLG